MGTIAMRASGHRMAGDVGLQPPEIERSVSLAGNNLLTPLPVSGIRPKAGIIARARFNSLLLLPRKT
jgi:hypothetical protein